MRHCQIRTADSRIATLWFLGWGFDGHIADFLPDVGNVIALWDYTTLEDKALDLSPWQEVEVKAWSMGVWAAETFLRLHPDVRVKKATAICGTPMPADPSLGIGAEAIRLTIDHFDEANRDKFARKIALSPQLTPTVRALLAHRDAADQKAELEAILAAQADSDETSHRTWDAAVTGRRDRIFPLAAQRLWWATHAKETEERDCPHWPF